MSVDQSWAQLAERYARFLIPRHVTTTLASQAGGGGCGGHYVGNDFKAQLDVENGAFTTPDLKVFPGFTSF